MRHKWHIEALQDAAKPRDEGGVVVAAGRDKCLVHSRRAWQEPYRRHAHAEIVNRDRAIRSLKRDGHIPLARPCLGHSGPVAGLDVNRQVGRPALSQWPLRPPRAEVSPALAVSQEKPQRRVVRHHPHQPGAGGAGDHDRREIALVGSAVDVVVVGVGTAVAVVVVAVGEHRDPVSGAGAADGRQDHTRGHRHEGEPYESRFCVGHTRGFIIPP